MGKDDAVTELELSKTDDQELSKKKSKGGRTRRTPDVGLWAVRGVDYETRAIIEKAANKSGKTIGQFVNEDIRRLVQEQLTQSKTPMAPMDIQNQIEHLTRMVESLTNRMPEIGKKSLWQRILGK